MEKSLVTLTQHSDSMVGLAMPWACCHPFPPYLLCFIPPWCSFCIAILKRKKFNTVVDHVLAIYHPKALSFLCAKGGSLRAYEVRWSMIHFPLSLLHAIIMFRTFSHLCDVMVSMPSYESTGLCLIPGLGSRQPDYPSVLFSLYT